MTDPTAPRELTYDERATCAQGKPHVWVRIYGHDGFPAFYNCLNCGLRAPEAFCRTPDRCVVAGRCLAEVCCNE